MSLQPAISTIEKLVFALAILIVSSVYAYFYAAHTSNIGHGKYWFTAIHPFNPTIYTKDDFPLTLDVRIAPTNFRAIRLKLVPKFKADNTETAKAPINATINVVDLNGATIDTKEGVLSLWPDGKGGSVIRGSIIFVAPAGRYNIEIKLYPDSVLDSNDLLVEFSSTYR